MKDRQRQILFLASALISLFLLAAPASGADWFSFHVGTGGVGISFGSSNWWTYGASWDEPHLQLSFDAVLNGYGEWAWVDGLGRVWRPWVAAGWTPYLHGRWVVTSAGWTWVSYEPWGYFPHHYGHWAYTSHGWAWVPGYTYRPANVVWVHWGGYVGWYPCPPHGWSHAARGFDHGYQRGYRDGYGHGYDGGYRDGWRDAEWATYVHWNHLSSQDVSRYATNSTLLRRTSTNSEPRISNAAPSRAEVQRRGVEMAPTVRLEQRTVTLGGRNVTVARPEGMIHSVRQHAQSTVERALPLEISRRVAGRGSPSDVTSSADPSRSRNPIPADSSGRISRSAPSSRAPARSQDSAAVERSTSSRTDDARSASVEHAPSARASTDRMGRQPANVASRSATASQTGTVGRETGSLQRRGESRQVNRPGAPGGRASTAASPPAPSGDSQGRRSEPGVRDESIRDRKPESRLNVSRTREKGTVRVKRR